MAKKRPEVNLTPVVEPRTGDLEKLFSIQTDSEQAAGLDLLAVRLEAIQNDPDQPRRTFPEDSLQELSDSIREEGVIQPIELTEIGSSQYQLVHGERRWRAAAMAGLETIPAVVRRIQYDGITRLVRQLVENIQREDLNDVDRAAGLLRLRDLLQSDLDTLMNEGKQNQDIAPWSKTVTWAKVGKRLGMSRQRIHQLIRLLDLPDEIKEDVREGRLSERDTRIYQGLQARQQRDLHVARYKRDLSVAELQQVAKLLKNEPGKTVYQAIREVRHPMTTAAETSFESSLAGAASDPDLLPGAAEMRMDSWLEGGLIPPDQREPTNIERLDWVREHLARIRSENLSRSEYQEIFRRLTLIQQDVTALLASLLEEELANSHQ